MPSINFGHPYRTKMSYRDVSNRIARSNTIEGLNTKFGYVGEVLVEDAFPHEFPVLSLSGLTVRCVKLNRPTAAHFSTHYHNNHGRGNSKEASERGRHAKTDPERLRNRPGIFFRKLL